MIGRLSTDRILYLQMASDLNRVSEEGRTVACVLTWGAETCRRRG